MSKYGKPHKKSDTFLQTFLIFFAGSLCGSALEVLLGQLISSDFNITTNLSLLLFCTGSIVAITVQVMRNIEIEIDSQVKLVKDNVYETSNYIKDVADRMSSSEMTARYIKNGQTFQDDPGYVESLARIRAAEKSIRIIGDFSPDWMPLVPPGKRNEYLSAIEERVKEAILDPTVTSFEYTRIIQRNRKIVQNVRDSSMRLCQSDMEEDLQAFIHSYKVQNIKDTYGSHNDGTRVSICLSEPVPNCPSMLLVDEKYMLFTIPTQIHRPGQPTHIGTHGVMLFQELANGKAFAEDFSSVFETIKDAAIRVRLDKPY
jgi:hypothetical protein